MTGYIENYRLKIETDGDGKPVKIRMSKYLYEKLSKFSRESDDKLELKSEDIKLTD